MLDSIMGNPLLLFTFNVSIIGLVILVLSIFDRS